jgi:hypothetical protein
MKKVLTWLGAAFVIFFIASRPEGAANLTQWLGNALATIANGIGDFFARLVS